MPRRFPLREVEPFVEEKRPWIERTLRRMREAEAELPPARLEDGGEVPYLGERLRACACASEPARAARARARAAATRCAWRCARSRRPLPADGASRRSSAGTAAGPAPRSAPRLDAACARAGTTYARLQIRGQRTRWASCSSSGAMSFNWRLLLAPAGDPRLRGRARGGPPRGARPLASASGRCWPRAARTSASTSAGCAATGTRCGC